MSGEPSVPNEASGYVDHVQGSDGHSQSIDNHTLTLSNRGQSSSSSHSTLPIGNTSLQNDMVSPRGRYEEMTESTRATEKEITLRTKVEIDGRSISHELMDDRSPTETLVNGRYHKEGKELDSEDIISWERVVRLDLGNGPENVMIIDWAPNDPENPFNLPSHRKAIILATACLIAFCTALNCTSVAITATWGTAWFGVDHVAFIASQTIMMVSIALTPMILAPASEVLSSAVDLPLSGVFSSVGNSMVGGTVADLYRPHQRGTAMVIFALINFIGGSMGSVATGWVGMLGGLQWTYGYQAILSAISVIFNLIFLRETRGDVLLSRRARKLTKSTGRKHLCAADLQRKSILQLVKVSLIRPFLYLATEPIVSALSAWIGFAWSCMFLGASSTILVFEQYNWNPGQLGSIQATLAIGGILGALTNYHQEYLYTRKANKSPTGYAPPEARLYHAAYVGLLYPLGFMAYAWTGRPEVPWIVPAIMLTISYWGLFSMYAGVFNYIADAYEIYSSSAQAAQSFVRNIGAAIIPQFGRQIYQAMGYPYASTMVASISLVLGIAPILLLRYGKVLRARSRVASALEKESRAIDGDDT